MCSIRANLRPAQRSSAGPLPLRKGAYSSVNFTLFVKSHLDPICGFAADESLPLEGKVWLGWLTIHVKMLYEDAEKSGTTDRFFQ